MIAALFVATNGPYFGLEGVDPWDALRDARKYSGPYPVIAHPPCQRWGRYWFGGPSAKVRKKLGDDDGCFESALNSVRNFKGVLEHPEASHAFKRFQLPIPSYGGGWSEPDRFGGRSICVAQGHYGHPAQKMTWLYGILDTYPTLISGRCFGKMRMDAGYHSKEERARAIKTGICQRLSKKQRLLTPVPFRDLLISMVAGL